MTQQTTDQQPKFDRREAGAQHYVRRVLNDMTPQAAHALMMNLVEGCSPNTAFPMLEEMLEEQRTRNS